MSQYIFILVWIAAMFFLKSVMSGGYKTKTGRTEEDAENLENI